MQKYQLERYSQILVYMPISMAASERMSYSILSFCLLAYLFLPHSSTHSIWSPTKKNPTEHDNIIKPKVSVEIFSCLDNLAKMVPLKYYIIVSKLNGCYKEIVKGIIYVFSFPGCYLLSTQKSFMYVWMKLNSFYSCLRVFFWRRLSNFLEDICLCRFLNEHYFLKNHLADDIGTWHHHYGKHSFNKLHNLKLIVAKGPHI